MNMEKCVAFASHWKSRKLLLMLLTMFYWTGVLPKKVWEVFWAIPYLPRWLLACVILERLVNFLTTVLDCSIIKTYAWIRYTTLIMFDTDTWLYKEEEEWMLVINFVMVYFMNIATSYKHRPFLTITDMFSIHT